MLKAGDESPTDSPTIAQQLTSPRSVSLMSLLDRNNHPTVKNTTGYTVITKKGIKHQIIWVLLDVV